MLMNYMFLKVYGRCCSAPFVVDVARLDEPATHLTNYSVQKALVQPRPLGSARPGSSITTACVRTRGRLSEEGRRGFASFFT